MFENYLYATNSDNANTQQKTSVIRVNRFNSTEYQVVTRVDKGGALHIYHQRRQPRGKWSPRLLQSQLRITGLQILLLFQIKSASRHLPQPANPGFSSHRYPWLSMTQVPLCLSCGKAEDTSSVASKS